MDMKKCIESDKFLQELLKYLVNTSIISVTK